MCSGSCQAPAEKTNDFKWFTNEAGSTVGLGAAQSSQSTSTHLSYSPAPECHILTEGGFMSSKQVPGPALPAALAAIYYASVAAYCGAKMMLCSGSSSPVLEPGKRALKAEANCQQATMFLGATPVLHAQSVWWGWT